MSKLRLAFLTECAHYVVVLGCLALAYWLLFIGPALSQDATEHRTDEKPYVSAEELRRAKEARQYEEVKEVAEAASTAISTAMTDSDPATTPESAAAVFAATHPTVGVFLPHSDLFNIAPSNVLVQVEAEDPTDPINFAKATAGPASDNYRGELLWLRATSEGVTTHD